MSSSDRTPTFYSYSLTGMDGFNSVTKLEGGPKEVLHKTNMCTYKLKTDQGQPLSPTLFTKDVLEGMVAMQGQMVGQEQEPPSEVMLLSDAEAVVEFSKRANIERIMVWMSPLQYWLGQKVHLVCRQATPEEARRHEEKAERESIPDN